MKKQEKRMIAIIVIIGIILVAVLLIWRNNANKGNEQEQGTDENPEEEKYVEVLEDGTKLNISDKLSETKRLDGLEISGIQFTYQNGMNVLLATVTNTTSQDVDLTPIAITLYDDKGNEIETVQGLISPCPAGGQVQLNMGVSADYANAYDFSVSKI